MTREKAFRLGISALLTFTLTFAGSLATAFSSLPVGIQLSSVSWLSVVIAGLVALGAAAKDIKTYLAEPPQ